MIARSQLVVLVLLLLFSMRCTDRDDLQSQSVLGLINGSFESNTSATTWQEVKGWEGKTGELSGDGYFAPVDGESYAIQEGNSDWIYQSLSTAVESGKQYKFKIWARSINEADNGSATVAEIAFLVDDKVVRTTSQNVNAPQLKGIAATVQNDDGANVWLDGVFRHQFADVHMYQPIENDPIEDPWLLVEGSNYEALEGLGWAVGNVIVGSNRYIYGTVYRDDPDDFYSSITLTKSTDSGTPDYSWTDPVVILDHYKTEFPWVLDAHLYHDESTGKLWMTWGGGIIYVAEMDPATGMFVNQPANTEYDTHPKDMHTEVATWPETDDSWCGDQWSSCWMEGAALYKYENMWYLFASYGNLGTNYTIRVGRGNNPTGLFYDKHGLNMMEYDRHRAVYGNSMLLGDEGIQLVPGHPHIWQEQGTHYLGYDYRKSIADGEPGDYMGIRRIFWYDGWPTIWMPVELSFDADDHPEYIGKALSVAFRNAGEDKSILAVDAASLTID